MCTHSQQPAFVSAVTSFKRRQRILTYFSVVFLLFCTTLRTLKPGQPGAVWEGTDKRCSPVVEMLLGYKQVLQIRSHDRRCTGGASPSRRPSR